MAEKPFLELDYSRPPRREYFDVILIRLKICMPARLAQANAQYGAIHPPRVIWPTIGRLLMRNPPRKESALRAEPGTGFVEAVESPKHSDRQKNSEKIHSPISWRGLPALLLLPAIQHKKNDVDRNDAGNAET